MPTYAYRCTSCGNEFEVRQSFTDDALRVCGVCGGELRKLFGNVGVVFKGSGFYSTDNKSSSSSLTSKDSSAKKTSTASSTSTPASTGGSDSSAPAAPAKAASA